VKTLGEPTKVFKTRQKTNCFNAPLKNDMFPSQGQEDITTVVKTTHNERVLVPKNPGVIIAKLQGLLEMSKHVIKYTN
jgi:hypothetical protein